MAGDIDAAMKAAYLNDVAASGRPVQPIAQAVMDVSLVSPALQEEILAARRRIAELEAPLAPFARIGIETDGELAAICRGDVWNSGMSKSDAELVIAARKALEAKP
jgi:hypothetical protein